MDDTVVLIKAAEVDQLLKRLALDVSTATQHQSAYYKIIGAFMSPDEDKDKEKHLPSVPAFCTLEQRHVAQRLND